MMALAAQGVCACLAPYWKPSATALQCCCNLVVIPSKSRCLLDLAMTFAALMLILLETFASVALLLLMRRMET